MRKATAWFCGLSLGYAALSAAFSAWTIGATFDELKTYNAWGLQYLAHPRQFSHFDHPPFSFWFGALLPKLTGRLEPFYFRFAPVWLYVMIGLLAVSLFQRAGKRWAAGIFALFYCFDPSLKAMASLQLTEIVSLFVLASTVCLWAFAQEQSLVALAASAGFIGLAVGTKITALLFCPFLVLTYLVTVKRPTRRHAGLIAACAVLGLYAAYMGNPDFLPSFWKSLEFQAEHGGKGHTTALFGEISRTGYWYFYFILFPLKSTPVMLLLFGAAAVSLVAARGKDLSKVEATLFLLPPLVLFYSLSRGKVQIGYRYFLPGLVLLYVCAALILERRLSRLRPKTAWAALMLCLTGAVAVDAATLATGSYLSYFNFLTPSPTRNFVDSNIDWLQGLPRHLQSRYAYASTSKELFNFLSSQEDTRPFLVGATELGGIWGASLSPHLRALPSETTVAGHEVVRVSKNQLYVLLKNRRPFSGWDSRARRFDLVDASQPIALLPQKQCPTGTTLRTLSRPLLQDRWIEAAPLPPGAEKTPGPAAVEGTLSLTHAEDTVLFFESNLGGTVLLNGKARLRKQAPFEKPILVQYWFSIDKPNTSVSFRQEGDYRRIWPGYAPYFRALQLWQECAAR